MESKILMQRPALALGLEVRPDGDGTRFVALRFVHTDGEAFGYGSFAILGCLNEAQVTAIVQAILWAIGVETVDQLPGMDINVLSANNWVTGIWRGERSLIAGALCRQVAVMN